MANIATLLVNIGVKIDGSLAVEGKLKKIRKSAKEMGRDGKVAATRFGRAFQKMGRAVRKTAARARASISKLIDRMGGLRNIATAGGIAVAGAAVGIFKLVESQTAALDATNKMSTSLGIGIEELQRLRFIAGQSGVATSTLERAMRNVNRNMLDVASGGGKAVRENLETLGLTIEDLNGLSRTQQLGLIGERLQGISDDARRSAISAKLFGEVAGPEMASLLAEGRDGLERLGAQAKNVFSQADADRASAFQDRLGEVKDQVGALVMGIAVDLLPTVQDLILDMQAWLAENEGLIAQKIPETIGEIVDAGRTLVGVFESVAEVMSALGIETDAAEVAFLGLATAVAGSIHPMLALLPIAMKLGAELAKMAIIGGSAGATMGNIADISATNVQTAALAAQATDAQMARIRAEFGEAGFSGTGRRIVERPSRGRGGGGGGKAKRARGGKGGGRLAAALRGAGELTQDALFRLQTGLPRRGGASVDEAIDVLLSGRGEGSPLFENLQRMAARTPATKDIKPTVAMDLTINQDIDIEQHIVAPDPESAADKSAVAIRRVFQQETAKAGQAIAGNVVR